MAPNAKIAIRVGDWKLLANGDLTQFELYNLQDDERESNDVKDRQPQRFAQLRDQLMALNSEIEAEGPDWWRRLSANGGQVR